MRIPTHYVNTSGYQTAYRTLSGTSNSGTSSGSSGTGTYPNVSDSWNYMTANYHSGTVSSTSGSVSGSGTWTIEATMTGGSPYRLTSATVSDSDWEMGNYYASGSIAYAEIYYYGSDSDPTLPRVTFSYDYAPYIYNVGTTILSSLGLWQSDWELLDVTVDRCTNGFSGQVTSIGPSSFAVRVEKDYDQFLHGVTVGEDCTIFVILTYRYTTTTVGPPYTATVNATLPYSTVRNVQISSTNPSNIDATLTSSTTSRNVSVSVETPNPNQSFSVTISYQYYSSSGYYVYDIRLNGDIPSNRREIKFNGKIYTARG